MGGTALAVALILLWASAGSAATSFDVMVSYPTDGISSWSSELHDVTGDGVLDVVMASHSPPALGLLKGTVDGGFESLRTFEVEHRPTDLVVADFSGDGHDDVAFSNYVLNGQSFATILVNDRADGFFVAEEEFLGWAAHGPSDISGGDFNSDGRPDLIVSSVNGQSVTTVLNVGEALFEAGVTYDAACSIDDVAVGDLNADSYQDVIFACLGGEGVGWMFGDGAANLSTPSGKRAGVNLFGIALGDADEDGLMDVAVADSPESSPARVHFLKGLGAAGLADAHVVAAQQVSSSGESDVDFADLDNDGHLDLVAVGQHGGLLVAIGQGDGRFSSQGVYAEGSGMRDVSVGDVDRDGLVDAVAASEGYIRVFLNEEVPDPPTPTPTPSSTPVSPSPDPSPTPTEPPLGPPRFLTAVGGNGEITLAWQEPEVGNPSEYIIYIQGVDGSLSELDRTTSSRLHYTDRGLGADIQRTYRVAARSGSTSSLMSEIATATTFGRAASPRAVRASPGSEIGSIVVSWEAPASSGGTSVLGYRLCRSTRFGERGFCADVGDTFVYTDSDNRLLTDYYYSVSALTVVGEGMPSGQDCSHAFPELTIVSC